MTTKTWVLLAGLVVGMTPLSSQAATTDCLKGLFSQPAAPEARSDWAPVSVADLIGEFEARNKAHPELAPRHENLEVYGLDGKTAYNPTAPFEAGDGTRVIGVRVESLHSETDTVVRFFRETSSGKLTLAEDMPQFPLQDPFQSRIHGELIVGGVLVRTVGYDGAGHPIIDYRTAFYRDHAKGLRQIDAEPFAMGPEKMKDIRLAEIKGGPLKGRIVVATRPQSPHGPYGPGKIGFTVIDRIADLTPEKILNAKILENLFKPEEWGGVNEMSPLENGWIAVLGHMAGWTMEADGTRTRIYVPIKFAYNPSSGQYTRPEVLAVRYEGAAKKSDLVRVFFTGGIVRNQIYLGAGDIELQRVTLASDPFEEFRLLP